MVSFKTKKLDDNLTLGERLIKLRKAKGVDLVSLEKSAGISRKYLVALEEGRYQNLPSYIYAKNYLRNYLLAIGISQVNDYLRLFEIERNMHKKTTLQISPSSHRFSFKKYFNKIEITPQRIKLAFITAIILICFGYLGWETKKIVSSPLLAVESPENDLVTNKPLVEVKGKTEKEVKLTINDQEIFVDANGDFSDKIFLQDGLNIIKISAIKKYSKSSTTFRKVLVIGGEEKKENVSLNIK